VRVDPSLAQLYAGAALQTTGLSHVVAAVRHAGRLHVLAIGPHAPQSPTDFFVLQATRARADVILTSARNLRAEPHLQHAFVGERSDALKAYRRSLGKPALPTCAILSASGDVPKDHLSFADGTPKLVLTLPAREQALAKALRGKAEVLGIAGLSPTSAVTTLRARGFGLISLEAGPSTAAPLYAASASVRVDELLLTLFEGALPDLRGLGPALPDDALLLSGLALRGESRIREPAGDFVFRLYQRQRASEPATALEPKE
jgi:riboflavin biosynthesis pyrimidine reductase